MAQCTGQIAASIGLNCEHPIVGGYTGRVLLLLANEIREGATVGQQNPRFIGLPSANAMSDLVVIAVDNAEFTTPLDGSSTTGNEDDGFRKFTKALAIRIPERGGKVSKDVIEPLLRNGNFVAVAEKKDMTDDGSHEIIGFYSPMRVADPSTVSRSENENGGVWSATLQCSEYYGECVLAQAAGQPTYSANSQWFDDVWAVAKPV